MVFNCILKIKYTFCKVAEKKEASVKHPTEKGGVVEV